MVRDSIPILVILFSPLLTHQSSRADCDPLQKWHRLQQQLMSVMGSSGLSKCVFASMQGCRYALKTTHPKNKGRVVFGAWQPCMLANTHVDHPQVPMMHAHINEIPLLTYMMMILIEFTFVVSTHIHVLYYIWVDPLNCISRRELSTRLWHQVEFVPTVQTYHIMRYSISALVAMANHLF